MKEHLPEWRDRHRERERARQRRALGEEPSDGRRSSWRRAWMLGLALALVLYLIASCFYEAELHRPKGERGPRKSPAPVWWQEQG
jgi:hypothetical protein